MREDRDLKQKEIAEAIGITQRKYSYLETGCAAVDRRTAGPAGRLLRYKR